MKKRVFLLTATVLLILSGCSQKNENQQEVVEKQAKQIEALTYEKNQLEQLIRTQNKNTSVDSSSSDELEEDGQDALTGLFQDFIHAEFEQDKEKLSELTTAPFYTVLTDNAGEAETDVLFQSTVTSIDVYKVEQVDDSAYFVGKIIVETKVGDYAPNSYEQLIECTAQKNSENVFQVDSQQLTTLAQ